MNHVTLLPNIIDLDVNSILEAPFQPPSRMTPSSLARLRSQIEKVGRIINPLAIGCDGYLGDGHRRLACAKMLHYPTVPARIFQDLTSAQLWDVANGASKRVTQREWGYASANGLPDESIPTSTRLAIMEIRRLIGDSEFNTTIASKYSARSILSWSRKVSRYVDQDTDEFLAATIRWIAKFGSQYQARRAMEDGCPLDILKTAILTSQPLRLVWTT